MLSRRAGLSATAELSCYHMTLDAPFLFEVQVLYLYTVSYIQLGYMLSSRKSDLDNNYQSPDGYFGIAE